MMADIRAKDTMPEMIVRQSLHAMGFRFRLHVRELPGRPDLVFPKYRAVIFVNGCFWFGHDCPLFKWPKTREEFWREKIGRNQDNDRANAARIAALGWRRLTIWECRIKRRDSASMASLFGQCRDWLASGNECLEIGAL